MPSNRHILAPRVRNMWDYGPLKESVKHFGVLRIAWTPMSIRKTPCWGCKFWTSQSPNSAGASPLFCQQWGRGPKEKENLDVSDLLNQVTGSQEQGQWSCGPKVCLHFFLSSWVWFFSSLAFQGTHCVSFSPRLSNSSHYGGFSVSYSSCTLNGWSFRHQPTAGGDGRFKPYGNLAFHKNVRVVITAIPLQWGNFLLKSCNLNSVKGGDPSGKSCEELDFSLFTFLCPQEEEGMS